MKPLVLFISSVLSVALALSAYAAPSSPTSKGIVMLSSIRPLSLVVDDLVKGLPEGVVTSETLLEGNDSPHHFSMKVSDRERLNNADIIVWVGPTLERGLSKAILANGAVSGTSAGSTAVVQLDQIFVSSQNTRQSQAKLKDMNHDHHYWLSPKTIALLASSVTTALVERLPEHKTLLEKNLMTFQVGLAELDTSLRAMLASFADRPFVAYHHGFSHFVELYSLNQIAAITEVPDELISAKRLMKLKRTKKELGAKCLLVDSAEEKVGARYARILSVPVVHVDLLAVNPALLSYSGYLTEVGLSIKTCLTKIDHN